MSHFLLSYLFSGIWTMLVIATVDLVMPKKPPMGALWTLVSGILWPVFVAVVVAYVLGWRPRGT